MKCPGCRLKSLPSRLLRVAYKEKGGTTEAVPPLMSADAARLWPMLASGESRYRRRRGRDLGRGNLGRGARRDEVWVASQTHLRDIETSNLDLSRNTIRAQHFADDVEDHAADDNVPNEPDTAF